MLALFWFVLPQVSFADDFGDALKIIEYESQDSINLALPHITRLANKNYSSAEALLGAFYYKGISLSKDNKKAIEWLTKASLSGNTDAQEGLAYAHAEIDGITLNRTNKEAALKYVFNFHQKEADTGKLAAIVVLGRMYEMGKGVDKNLRKSYELNKVAAEKGHRLAQYRLGRAYKYGFGTIEDYERAFQWYSKAADQGSTNAMSSLSLYYSEEYGPKPNRKLAAQWTLIGAKNGSFSDSKSLMLYYIEGRGFLQDYAEAYAWGLVYKQQLTYDDKQLDDYLKLLRDDLGSGGTIKAQARAKELLSEIRENKARRFLR